MSRRAVEILRGVDGVPAATMAAVEERVARATEAARVEAGAPSEARAGLEAALGRVHALEQEVAELRGAAGRREEEEGATRRRALLAAQTAAAALTREVALQEAQLGEAAGAVLRRPTRLPGSCGRCCTATASPCHGINMSRHHYATASTCHGINMPTCSPK